ncbi:hypothetical protein HanRHA438_Chr04g0168031 [Helianthus annuus]|nr:hypothetical protein HanRHA438_Chr04g0168031 [Helianthus annuus]
MMNYQFSSDSPKSFNAYPKGDFDIESNSIRKIRKPKHSSFHPVILMKSVGNRVMYYYKLHPLCRFTRAVLVMVLILAEFVKAGLDNGYPFSKLRNLVMVAGHSVYTSSSCEKVDKEDSWFLESYQKNAGQAATFVAHIKEGVCREQQR